MSACHAEQDVLTVKVRRGFMIRRAPHAKLLAATRNVRTNELLAANPLAPRGVAYNSFRAGGFDRSSFLDAAVGLCTG